MNDTDSNTEAPLTPEEVRTAMLHLAALDKMIPRVRGALNVAAGVRRSEEETLNISKEELAESLRILVKDPDDAVVQH